jgi:hypothetical protein
MNAKTVAHEAFSTIPKWSNEYGDVNLESKLFSGLIDARETVHSCGLCRSAQYTHDERRSRKDRRWEDGDGRDERGVN